MANILYGAALINNISAPVHLNVHIHVLIMAGVNVFSQRSLQRIEIDDIAGQVVETTDTSRDISAQSQDGNLTEKKEVHVHVDRRDSCSSHTSRTESTDNHTSPGVLRNSDQASIVNTSVNKSGEGVGITCSGSDSSPSVLQTPSTAAGGAECSQVEESPTTRNGVSDALPPTPETSFEFQCHWKQLRSSRPLLRAYFKVHCQCMCNIIPLVLFAESNCMGIPQTHPCCFCV